MAKNKVTEKQLKAYSKVGKITGPINIKFAIEARKKYPDLPYNNIHKRIFRIWRNMKQRCNGCYKEKDIKVCDEWLYFPNFYYWSINNGYADNLTIDRIDNNGNYEPFNCRWITNKEQQHNKNNNVYLTYENKTCCVSEWAEIVGIHKATLLARIKRGWDVEKILYTPPQTRNQFTKK